LHAEIAGQYYGPGTRLIVDDEIGNALIRQDKAQRIDQPTVDATEGAVELAKEHGLDLGAIEGSGKAGRILQKDVEQAIED
jgi:pyruvate/2-oxoglutarate dehydrogenase complex dihydrolipoamide acyltransferase (E2) component